MARKPETGAKGVTPGMTLRRALAIRNNKYRSVQKVAGGKDYEQDYIKEEIDDFIQKTQEKQASREIELLEKEQRRTSLFQNEDIIKMIANHINGIEKLEDKKAIKMMRKYREIRQDLRDRLDMLKGDTFTAQKLRGVMIQIDTALLQMSGTLKNEMTDAGKEISIKGINDTHAEIEKFEEKFTGAITPININVVEISQDTNNLLVNRYEASLDAYSEDVRSRIAMNLTTAAIEQISYSEIIRRLSESFQLEEWKLHRIARTELHNIYNLSKQQTMQDIKDSGQMPKLMKALFHPMDARTGEDSKQAAQQNPIVELNEPFTYIYRRKRKDGSIVMEKRIFMANDRPNDRAVVIPYQESWENE
jgi:hypothetical protein